MESQFGNGGRSFAMLIQPQLRTELIWNFNQQTLNFSTRGEDKNTQIVSYFYYYDLPSIKGERGWKECMKNRVRQNIDLCIKVMVFLTWISPGCVWRFAVQALLWDRKQLFNIAWVPKHQACSNPTGENVLCLHGLVSHTKGPAKSHQVHEQNTSPLTCLNVFFFLLGQWRSCSNVSPDMDFHLTNHR